MVDTYKIYPSKPTIMKSIRIRIEEKICYLGLNRPEKSNSLNKEMVIDLITFLTTTANDNNFKLLVLYGEGGGFCSGGCLEWMKQGAIQTNDENMADAKLFVDLFAAMRHYPKPIITSIEKYAFGGALGLVACSDIAIAEEHTVFGFKEVRIGLVPATIAPHVMNKIGTGYCKKFMLTGADFDADEAIHAGLIQYVAPTGRLKEKTKEMCRQITLSSAHAISQTKKLLNTLEDKQLTIEDQNKIVASYIANSRNSQDGIEGVNSFFEKRKPIWDESPYNKKK